MKVIIDLHYRGVRVDSHLVTVHPNASGHGTITLDIDSAVDETIGPERIACTIKKMAANVLQARRVLHTDNYKPGEKPA